MGNLTISALENFFENEKASMESIALLGESGSGKSELTKQMVGSFLKSGKKILWFASSTDENKLDVIDKWNAYRVKNKEQLNKETLANNRFLYIETTAVDLGLLTDWLMDDSSTWIIVHEDLDDLVINYEHNSFVTEKLDFLSHITAIGRVGNIFTLVSGEDVKSLSKVVPFVVILVNSKNLVLLKQSHRSTKALKEYIRINEEQEIRLKDLPKYEAIILKR